jgi:hypothetical protein
MRNRARAVGRATVVPQVAAGPGALPQTFRAAMAGLAIDSFALRHDNARALRRAVPHGFQS